jgi:hypothetical protein
MSLLFEYGIQTEDSTHRLHIDVKNMKAFIFSTPDGVTALPEPVSITSDDDWDAGDYYIIYPTWANGKPTARGIRIPPDRITGCTTVNIPGILSPLKAVSFDTTSEKGRLAESIGLEMLKAGLIPISMNAEFVTVKDMQITGVDAYCQPVKMEIKHDYDCFHRGLFLQTHERNEQKQF